MTQDQARQYILDRLAEAERDLEAWEDSGRASLGKATYTYAEVCAAAAYARCRGVRTGLALAARVMLAYAGEEKTTRHQEKT